MAFLMLSSCRSSIFFTDAVFLRAPRMKAYWWLSPIFRACCAFLMKSSANRSCWRIERSIAFIPWRIFISRSMRRSSLLLKRPMAFTSSLRGPYEHPQPKGAQEQHEHDLRVDHRSEDCADHGSEDNQSEPSPT